MILVLSPSKTLDFETPAAVSTNTLPEMLEESLVLVKELRRYTPEQLRGLMGVSDKLARLNAQRYQAFCTPFTGDNARPALLAFKGDVYEGMDIAQYRKEDFAFAQQHVRILSGLYGVLRPLDLMQPYRLEMGTRLPTPRGSDLYAFWGSRITGALNRALAEEKHKFLINLASEEYFKAVRPKELEAGLVNVAFKEDQKGKLRVVGLFAKRARGLMADFIVKNRIDNPEGLQAFNREGYRFEPSLSNDGQYIFLR